ncbi:MAG: HYC_CC_PP family protein [Bacteroidota bacterium]
MLKRISAILLSVLLLVVNMSLTFSTHYCGGEAVETAVSLGKATVGCGMEKPNASPCDNEDAMAHIGKEDCCQNTHFTIAVEEDYVQNGTAEPVQLITDALPASVYSVQLPDSHFTVSAFIAYSPPQVRQNRQVLHQVFRL